MFWITTGRYLALGADDLGVETVDRGLEGFEDAFLMDAADIQSKFGNKYDDAILEAMDAIPESLP